MGKIWEHKKINEKCKVVDFLLKKETFYVIIKENYYLGNKKHNCCNL